MPTAEAGEAGAQASLGLGSLLLMTMRWQQHMDIVKCWLSQIHEMPPFCQRHAFRSVWNVPVAILFTKSDTCSLAINHQSTMYSSPRTRHRPSLTYTSGGIWYQKVLFRKKYHEVPWKVPESTLNRHDTI